MQVSRTHFPVSVWYSPLQMKILNITNSKKSNEAFLLSKRDNYRCMGSFMSSNLFFQGMMYLVTLVYGGYLIANGEMQTADLAMYALYIGIFISPHSRSWWNLWK